MCEKLLKIKTIFLVLIYALHLCCFSTVVVNFHARRTMIVEECFYFDGF